jgi:hypothetical protein
MSSSNENDPNKPLSAQQEADFEKMLPWLVNGTLAEPERKALESALSQSKKLRQEKDFLSELQQQVKQQKMPDVPVEFAWQRMKRQIADEKQIKNNHSDHTDNNSKNAIKDNSVNADKKWRFVAMAASLLLIIQSSSLLVSWDQEDIYKPLSSDTSNTKINAARFTVQFADTATALEIQQLLRKHQLSLISGPSSIGLYQVSGPNESRDNAEKILTQLKSQSDVISHAQQDE